MLASVVGGCVMLANETSGCVMLNNVAHSCVNDIKTTCNRIIGLGNILNNKKLMEDKPSYIKSGARFSIRVHKSSKHD